MEHQTTNSFSTPQEVTDFMNPFPGLRPFGIEESHLFFGREGQSDEVLVKLAESKFVGVLGASGSGKSSLMYCGLIPTLYGGFMTDAGSNWKIVAMRPGNGPIDNLAESLLNKNNEYLDLSDEDKLIRKTITSTVLRSSSLGLIETVKQLNNDENENLLILVDQFEELFRYRKIEGAQFNIEESSAFVNLLLEAVHQYDQPIYIALTMRSDFIGECAQFPELTQMINDSHYLIPQMTRDQKRLAIEGPVAVGGGRIAPRLTQQLLNDVGDNPDQLPILQHALMRTWQYWIENHNADEPMDLRHYTAIGTIKEALSQHANEAYDNLTKREQEICEVMFKSLTEKGSENQGIRRPTKLSTIASIVGVSEDEVVHVVDKFREPGRTLLMPPYGVRLESETVVDISHESLMRIWTRLKQWLEEESTSASMYMKLAESAEQFQMGRAGLWQMPDLQLAINWQEENKPTLVWGQRYHPAYERTMVFLETSKKAYETEQKNKELLQKRALRRSRIVAITLGLAALVSIFFVVLAQIQANEAEKQTIAAEKARADAERLAEMAEENEADAIHQKNQAERAKEDAEAERLRAEEQAQRAIVAEKDAEQQAAIAREQAALAQTRAEQAETARADAERQTRLAQEQTDLAQKARADADRLRYQAIALSMAIKAKQIEDPQLKGLVASQAFTFFDDYSDKKFNGDIYVGIYEALKSLTTDSLNQFFGHQDGVRSVVYSPMGDKFYSAGADGYILKWFVDDQSRSPDTLLSGNNVNRVVGVSPDEQWLAMGGEDEQIYILDLKGNSADPIPIPGHEGAVFDLIFLPDGQGFISVGADGQLRKSTVDNSELIDTFDSRIKALAISDDGNFLAGGTESGDVLLWDMKNNMEKSTLYRKDDRVPIQAITFSHEGQYLIFGDEMGNIIMWDMEKKEEYQKLIGHKARITDIDISNDDELLAASSFDGSVRVWDINDIFELPKVLDDHEDWVWSVAFSPDSKTLISGSKDSKIRIWPIEPDEWAKKIGEKLNGNMSDKEWKQYVGEGIEYRETVVGLPKRSE